MRTLSTFTATALASLAVAACSDSGEITRPAPSPAPAADLGRSSPGAVYATTNEVTGNRVMVFDRAADGTLTPGGTFATGGTGSGNFEGSGNSLILGEQSPNNLNGGNHYLYAVNTGSSSISVFAVRHDGLELLEVENSLGRAPISVTVHKNLLYVLNSDGTQCTGGVPSITGFTVGPKGNLTPLPQSTRPLSSTANSGCSQISFTKDGGVLVVTERGADVISTFVVDRGTGLATGPITNQTSGNGPFGFTFTQRGQLLTAENFQGAAGQGGAASYDVGNDGILTPLGPTARNGRSDTCWIVNTDDGKYAYVTNAMSGDISSYSVAPDGTLVLLESIAGAVGFIAEDMSLSGNSRYLYARSFTQGTISSFQVQSNGALTPLQVLGGLPPGAVGLAAK